MAAAESQMITNMRHMDAIKTSLQERGMASDADPRWLLEAALDLGLTKFKFTSSGQRFWRIHSPDEDK